MDWPGIDCDKVMTKHLIHSTAFSNPKTHVHNVLKFSSYPTENSLHNKDNVFKAIQENTSCSFWESWNICGEKCSLLMVKKGTSISYHSQTVIKALGNYEINSKWFWNNCQSHKKMATHMRVPMIHPGSRRDRNWRKPICLPHGKNQFWTNLYAIQISLQQVRNRPQQLDEQKTVWTLPV